MASMLLNKDGLFVLDWKGDARAYITPQQLMNAFGALHRELKAEGDLARAKHAGYVCLEIQNSPWYRNYREEHHDTCDFD